MNGSDTLAELRVLRRGMSGPQVEFLQLALTRAGYALAKDGVFGRATENAVRNFQNNNGLAADGVAGERTWRGLTPYLTGYTTYTIRRGDTLYRLAEKYGTTVSAIETANPGLDPFRLRVGSVLTIPLGFSVVPTDIRFTSTVLEYSIRGLKARYPFLNVGDAGKSVMGKRLWSITAGSGERQAFYNASHHANEWITSTLVMKFLEEYAESYARDGEIFGIDAESLFARTELTVMPMVNPDGVDLVTEELSSGPYYEQARVFADDYPAIAFPSGWKANISGVDTNLQYPAGWEQAREIKFSQGFTSPAPRDYVGEAPLVAPESRAVYNLTVSKDFGISLSFHTQGEVIFWKYLDIEPENAFYIAQRFSDVSGYYVENTPYESGFAGYKDWFILTYDRPGYTIEAGSGVSPLPLAQFDEIYRDNLGILALGLQYA